MFNEPVVHVEQTSVHLNFQLRNAQGAVLATAVQTVGQKKSGFARWLGAAPSTTSGRAALVVSRPDGAPLCFIDRPDHQPPPGMGGRHLPPVFVVAPNGALFGQLTDSKEGFQGRIGLGPLQLLDPNNQLLCTLAVTRSDQRGFTPVEGSSGGVASDGKREWSVNDPAGRTMATLAWNGRFRGGGTYTLRLHCQLPEPLATLLEMTPVAITLRQSG